MDLCHIRTLILFAACGIGNLTSTLDAAEKSIMIDRESHEIQGKVTYKKSFPAQINSTEYTLLFEQHLQNPSSGGYWNVQINDKLLGRLEAHIPQIDSDQKHDEFHRIGFAVPAAVLKEGENSLTVTGRGQPAVLRNIELIARPLQQA